MRDAIDNFSFPRIEVLMYFEFVAQIIAALIERDLRKKMVEKNIDWVVSMPLELPPGVESPGQAA